MMKAATIFRWKFSSLDDSCLKIYNMMMMMVIMMMMMMMMIAAAVFRWNFSSLDDSPSMNTEYKINHCPLCSDEFKPSMLSPSAPLTCNTACRPPPTRYTLSHAALCLYTSLAEQSASFRDAGHGLETTSVAQDATGWWGSDTGVVTSPSNLLRQCMDVARLACIYVGMRRDAVSDAARWQLAHQ